MAYSLSLADLPTSAPPQEGAYQLSLSDIDNVPRGTPAATQAAPQETGFFDNLAQGIQNVGKRAVAATQTGIHDVLNIPNKIAPGAIPAYRPGYDYYKAMGIQRSPLDAITESLVSFAPYAGAANKAVKGVEALSPMAAKLIAKAPNLIKGSLASSAMGAVEAPEGQRGLGAGIGAATGAAGVGLGKLADMGFRAGARKFAQSGIPGLIEHATEKVKGYMSPEKGAQLLQNNYRAAAAVNNGNWQTVDKLASEIDTGMKAAGQQFNAAPFENSVKSFLDNTAKMEPAVRAKYELARGFANHVLEQSPKSFEGLVALRKNLNQELKKYLEKNNIKATDRETSVLIKDLKDSLGETLKGGLQGIDEKLMGNFSKAWDVANKSHIGLQEFYKTPNPQGVLKPRVPRREALEQGVLEANALGQYLRTSARGVQGMQQLGKLTGNDEVARSFLMKNILEGRGKQDALALYEKLSPAQREQLFKGLPEGEALKTASELKGKFRMPEKENKFLHHMGAFGIPGVLGFGAAKMAGLGWDEAIGAGIGAGLAPRAANAILRTAAGKEATPAALRRIAKIAEKKGKSPGRYVNPVLTNATLNSMFPEA